MPHSSHVLPMCNMHSRNNPEMRNAIEYEEGVARTYRYQPMLSRQTDFARNLGVLTSSCVDIYVRIVGFHGNAFTDVTKN